MAKLERQVKSSSFCIQYQFSWVVLSFISFFKWGTRDLQNRGHLMGSMSPKNLLNVSIAKIPQSPKIKSYKTGKSCTWWLHDFVWHQSQYTQFNSWLPHHDLCSSSIIHHSPFIHAYMLVVSLLILVGLIDTIHSKTNTETQIGAVRNYEWTWQPPNYYDEYWIDWTKGSTTHSIFGYIRRLHPVITNPFPKNWCFRVATFMQCLLSKNLYADTDVHIRQYYLCSPQS